MKGTKDTGIPGFQSLEEERGYWEARGPLAEGRKVRIGRPTSGQKRSSFLAVRLTGEELTRLREVAAKQGLGPSTFARTVLKSTVEHQGELPKSITLDELFASVQKNLTQPEIDKIEGLEREIAIGDPNNPLMFTYAGNENEWKEITFLWLRALLAMLSVKITFSEKKVGQATTDTIKTEIQ